MCNSNLKFRTMLIVVGGMFLVGIGIKLGLEQGWFDRDIVARVIGIGIAFVLVITGNSLPKFVQPIETTTPGIANNMAFERFAGAAFVMAGVIGILGWMLLTPKFASLLFAVAGLGAGCAVVLHGLTQFGDIGRQNLMRLFTFRFAVRQSPFLAIHAILWVCVFFLLDYVFGDGAVQWAIIAFALFNSVLSMWFSKIRQKTRS